MRVTQLLLSKGFGGAERYFVDLVRYLTRAGHEVQAICHRHSDSARALDNEPGLQLQTVNLLGLWDVFGVRTIAGLTRRFDPDVVHGHLSRGAWAGGKVTAGKNGPRLVVNLHNYVKLKYYRQVDLFIPVTRHQQRFLREHGVPEDKVTFIPNFSPLPPVDEVRAAGAGPVQFLSYGRMVEKKGFADLLHAFARIRQQGLDARLVLGGDGAERHKTEALARKLGVAEHLELPGWIEDVGDFLASADVFVLPSRLEPFGIVVLEAMSRGVPIVTTRTEGPTEVLDADTAYFAEIADPASLADAMHAAAVEPEQRTAKARAALHRYRANYHDSVVVPRIIEAYRSAVTAGSHDGPE